MRPLSRLIILIDWTILRLNTLFIEKLTTFVGVNVIYKVKAHAEALSSKY